jgi:NodT family efflux transporter outer membrane factor (OMF) lipoprotein
MVIFILGGCSSASREPQSPLQETPESFSRSGSDTVPDSWWTTFDDPQLNEFIDRALEKNFDVRTAWNRLEASRAVLERTSADLYPELTGSVSGDVRRTDSSQSFTSQDEEIRLGLSADYEVDLWGRIDSTVEAERFRTRATRQDYQTAAISLTAEVTRVWFQLLRQHQQHQLLQRQIETNRDVLDLLKKQFGAGQVRQADLLRQEQLLESTREQKIDIESSIQVLEHQLAVLLGRPPQGELEYQVDELPTLPPLPRTGLPVELIRRRPDVRSAFNQLQAADREVAAAISNQYPRLRFTASLSTFDDNSTTLFEDWARSFAGELTAPLLDANRRDAEVNRTEAVRNQRLYEYGQAILTAFQGVEDALVREKKQQEQITNLKGQLDLAERTVKRLRSQYLRGQGNYIDVLNALNEEQQLRRDLLNARLNLLETRVALYRAMAGGFENPESRTGASTPEETNQ